MSDQLTPEPAAYSMEEAARKLGVSRPFLYTLIDRGQLRRVKLGRRSLIPAAEIRRLLEEGAPLASSVEA